MTEPKQPAQVDQVVEEKFPKELKNNNEETNRNSNLQDIEGKVFGKESFFPKFDDENRFNTKQNRNKNQFSRPATIIKPPVSQSQAFFTPEVHRFNTERNRNNNQLNNVRQPVAVSKPPVTLNQGPFTPVIHQGVSRLPPNLNDKSNTVKQQSFTTKKQQQPQQPAIATISNQQTANRIPNTNENINLQTRPKSINDRLPVSKNPQFVDFNDNPILNNVNRGQIRHSDFPSRGGSVQFNNDINAIPIGTPVVRNQNALTGDRNSFSQVNQVRPRPTASTSFTTPVRKVTQRFQPTTQNPPVIINQNQNGISKEINTFNQVNQVRPRPTASNRFTTPIRKVTQRFQQTTPNPFLTTTFPTTNFFTNTRDFDFHTSIPEIETEPPITDVELQELLQEINQFAPKFNLPPVGTFSQSGKDPIPNNQQFLRPENQRFNLNTKPGIREPADILMPPPPPPPKFVSLQNINSQSKGPSRPSSQFKVNVNSLNNNRFKPQSVDTTPPRGLQNTLSTNLPRIKPHNLITKPPRIHNTLSTLTTAPSFNTTPRPTQKTTPLKPPVVQNSSRRRPTNRGRGRLTNNNVASINNVQINRGRPAITRPTTVPQPAVQTNQHNVVTERTRVTEIQHPFSTTQQEPKRTTLSLDSNAITLKPPANVNTEVRNVNSRGSKKFDPSAAFGRRISSRGRVFQPQNRIAPQQKKPQSRNRAPVQNPPNRIVAPQQRKQNQVKQVEVNRNQNLPRVTSKIVRITPLPPGFVTNEPAQPINAVNSITDSPIIHINVTKANTPRNQVRKIVKSVKPAKSQRTFVDSNSFRISNPIIQSRNENDLFSTITTLSTPRSIETNDFRKTSINNDFRTTIAFNEISTKTDTIGTTSATPATQSQVNSRLTNSRGNRRFNNQGSRRRSQLLSRNSQLNQSAQSGEIENRNAQVNTIQNARQRVSTRRKVVNLNPVDRNLEHTKSNRRRQPNINNVAEGNKSNIEQKSLPKAIPVIRVGGPSGLPNVDQLLKSLKSGATSNGFLNDAIQRIASTKGAHLISHTIKRVKPKSKEPTPPTPSRDPTARGQKRFNEKPDFDFGFTLLIV